MRKLKLFLTGFIGVVFLCGTMAMLIPTSRQAEATGFSAYFKKDKCEVPPTWGEIIRGKKRWVKKWDGAAYCDRQTGLVWDAEPEFDQGGKEWVEARQYCFDRLVGSNKGQKGWRLPSIAEGGTLVDTSSSTCPGLCLPDGHPFQIVPNDQAKHFWSDTLLTPADPSSTDAAGFDIQFGNVGGGDAGPAQAWCVRGAMYPAS